MVFLLCKKQYISPYLRGKKQVKVLFLKDFHIFIYIIGLHFRRNDVCSRQLQRLGVCVIYQIPVHQTQFDLLAQI